MQCACVSHLLRAHKCRDRLALPESLPSLTALDSGGPIEEPPSTAVSKSDVFAMLMEGSRSKWSSQSSNTDNDSRSSSSSSSTGHTPAAKAVKPQPRAGKPAAGGWANALSPYIINPEGHADSVYYYDDDLVVIYDKYPKAKFHLLVMPRKHVNGFEALTVADLPMLETMRARAQLIATEYVTSLTLAPTAVTTTHLASRCAICAQNHNQTQARCTNRLPCRAEHAAVASPRHLARLSIRCAQEQEALELVHVRVLYRDRHVHSTPRERRHDSGTIQTNE